MHTPTCRASLRDMGNPTASSAAAKIKSTNDRRRFTSDGVRWQAVFERSAIADGHFVFAVTSTGIYCRPSCPARRPNRSNVLFFETPEHAERAGFRACKRCHPQGLPPAEATVERIAAACRRIENAEEPPSLAALAATAGMSRWHFHRTFKAIVGLTPKAYGDNVRAARVRNLLANGSEVTAAAFEAGFASTGRFYATAERVLGMPPRAYRKGGRGETLSTAIVACSLGKVLVARSSKGICAILLGDDRQALMDELATRFPAATLEAGDKALAVIMADIVRHIDQPSLAWPDLPLDLRGTVFQKRVWNALRKIPPGSTLSYGDLALLIGAPKSVRAVARACGANPVAVAVPCHRVVGADGSLTGYRWGIERKEALLDGERSNPTKKAGKR